MVERLVGSYLVSERHACRVLRVPRATYRYRSCLDPRTELRMRIREIAQARVRYGDRKIRVLLNREGWVLNYVMPLKEICPLQSNYRMENRQ